MEEVGKLKRNSPYSMTLKELYRVKEGRRLRSERQAGCNDVSSQLRQKRCRTVHRKKRERARNTAAKVLVLTKFNPQNQGSSA